MAKKAVSGIMLILLLICMLTSIFSLTIAKADEGAYYEPPDIELSKTYGGADRDYAYSMIQTGDGGYAVAGWTRSYGAGGNDFWLVKTDTDGNMEWNQTYGGTDDDYGYSVVQTSDGGYAIAGATHSSGAGGSDFWLVKTDSAGNVQWNQTYGGTDLLEDIEQALSVIQTFDGGYAMAGHRGMLRADFWLVKTDSTGDMMWNKTYGGTSNDRGYSVVQTSDGGYAMAGDTESFGAGAGDDDFWLVKTDPSGSMEWNKTYGGTNIEYQPSVIQTFDGGYAMAGQTGPIGEVLGPFDLWLVKTDSAGTMQWNRTYGGTGSDYAAGCHACVQRGDGGYTIAGDTNSSGAGDYDFWLIKLSASARAVFDVTKDGESYDVAVFTNSHVDNFDYNASLNQISFNVTGLAGTIGSCNMTVPKELGDTFEVLVDGTPVDYTQTENATHYFLYFTYEHSTHTITINVKPSPSKLIERLIEDVKHMNLQQGIDNSLDAKLEATLAALEALNAEQRNDAVNKLSAFINEVEAQRGKKITQEHADYLASEAQRIIDLIKG